MTSRVAGTATTVYTSHEATKLRGRFVTGNRGSGVELWRLGGPLRWLTEVIHSCREIVMCVCSLHSKCVCVHTQWIEEALKEKKREMLLTRGDMLDMDSCKVHPC